MSSAWQCTKGYFASNGGKIVKMFNWKLYISHGRIWETEKEVKMKLRKIVKMCSLLNLEYYFFSGVSFKIKALTPCFSGVN